ncbi:MAG: protein kinase, partial [Thermoanaerobaculia bacterium]
MIGRTISHYRILERLGEGGMGEVYLAEDVRLERPVAIKVLRNACCTEEERNRLFAEARLASALNHPSIAVVYDVGEAETEAGPLPFLAMEYIAGEPIDLWARRERPGLDRLLEAAVEVARALAEAHARGIVHRDVKPSNLLVTAAGRVKVLDFGLALRRDPATATDSTATASVQDVAGTLAYMAPEQAKGLPVDARADVFSFGVVLYELLSGRRPFEGRSAWEIAGALLHREAAPLELDPAEPGAALLGALVARLLAKEPAARPARLSEVADELERIRRRADETDGRALSGAIAVAGFENLTGDAEDDWIGAGLAETIAADLARLAGAEVVGRERVAGARR